jgi:uncharacterized protein YlxP (DUF503 family)
MAAIGVVTLELRLENAHSLKEKRHVVESLKDRLRHKFNVAVAEIEYQELWQRAAVAAVTVSPDRVHAEKVLRAVEEEAAALLGAELTGATVEWLARELGGQAKACPTTARDGCLVGHALACPGFQFRYGRAAGIAGFRGGAGGVIRNHRI